MKQRVAAFRRSICPPGTVFSEYPSSQQLPLAAARNGSIETRRSQILRWVLLSQSIFLLAVSCPPSISFFDETAYQQATSLKVESLRLMAEATDSFSSHEPKVQQLRVDLDKAFEYAKGRPKNTLSTRQWALLLDPERNLLGGFLKRWEEEEALGPGFVGEARKIVSDAFDTVIELESGKIKEAEAQLVGE